MAEKADLSDLSELLLALRQARLNLSLVGI